MSKILFILFVLLLFVPAQGMTADKWSNQEVTLEATYYILKFIDWRQTRYIAKNPRNWSELNPILGKHPSVSAVDSYFMITTVFHSIITHYLPKKYRVYWQGITITVSGGFAGRNHWIGIEMDL